MWILKWGLSLSPFIQGYRQTTKNSQLYLVQFCSTFHPRKRLVWSLYHQRFFFRPWTMIARMPLFAMENIYFTDCVLRNMHRYRYIAHFDPDEVPVLLQQKSLPHLIKDINEKLVIKSWPSCLIPLTHEFPSKFFDWVLSLTVSIHIHIRLL